MLNVGAHRIIPLLDSVAHVDPGSVYRGIDADRWAPHRAHLDQHGRLELFIGAYVIESGQQRILIDAGVGPVGWTSPSGNTLPGGYLLDNLRVAGFATDDITDVTFTHLHPDHIGWATTDGTATFPNATYRCHRADWDHFVDNGSTDSDARRILEPIAERFDMWDGNETTHPGIDVVPATGHTPGSSIVVISSAGGERAMLLGDVVHCPVELVDDEWETFGDVDAALADATRIRVARELEGTETLIGAAHFPGLRFGRLLAGSGVRQWSFR